MIGAIPLKHPCLVGKENLLQRQLARFKAFVAHSATRRYRPGNEHFQQRKSLATLGSRRRAQCAEKRRAKGEKQKNREKRIHTAGMFTN